jgi:hypothetical protein
MKLVAMATVVVAHATFASMAFAAQQPDAQSEPAPAPEGEAPAPEAAPPTPEATPGKSDTAPPPPPALIAPNPAARHAKPAVTPLPAAALPPDADAVSRARADEGPIESRFNVRLDLDTVWNASPSFDLFSDRDTFVYPGIAIGYAVLRSESVALIPEVGFNGNHTVGGDVFGGAVSRTSLTTLNPYAGLSARWALFPILDLAARVSGGASFLSFDMDGSDSTRLSDDHVAPFFTVGGGFTLRTMDAAFETRSGALRSLVAGLGVEAGYIFAGSVDLTPTAPGDGRIETRYSSLGTLERSGPYVKTSLSARF